MRAPGFIQFVTYKQIPVIPEYRWWDKPRWWLVKVLGGVDPNESVRTVRVPIDAKKFMDRLYVQRRSLFDRFNLEPQTLLIGADDYEEMMGCKEITQQFAFNASYMHGNIEFYGLRIKVIPWMRGMLVMP